MTSPKAINPDRVRALKWPRHIIKPKELINSLQQKTQIQLIKSPVYSKLILQIVGSWAYLLAHVFNKSKIYNKQTFDEELRRIEIQNSENTPHQKGAPLMTISNHISCIDDPILWASLFPFTYYTTNTDSIRWSAAAVEICFSRPWHSTFFSLGKTFPVLRGVGLEQPGMEFASALLKCNQWLHLFPEGKVMRDINQQKISNSERGYIFKWGTAKLILDYFKSSNNDAIKSSEKNNLRILPFYHLGLDEILPIGWPYIPKVGKKITIFMRPSVIELNFQMLGDLLRNRTIHNQAFIKSKSNDTIKRIKLTNYLEEELEKLAEATTKLHYQN